MLAFRFPMFILVIKKIALTNIIFIKNTKKQPEFLQVA